MSRDLSFWKYDTIVSMNDNEVYAKLSNGEFVNGVAELPISDIIEAIETTLVGWSKLDETHFKHKSEMIEVYTTNQFVRFDCYQVSEEHMNVLIDIMLRYDCPLYDSVIEVRFG
jgi:hypothetical protein